MNLLKAALSISAMTLLSRITGLLREIIGASLFGAGATMDAFQAAAANADWNSQPGYGVILANQPGDKSWPMTAATWILLYKKPTDAAATAEALKFFAWSYAKGGKMAEELDYVPMPAKVVTDIEKMWSSEIKDASGKPLYSPTN